ncbi:hypothetical protein ACIBJE_02255 [Micromonospora sp. NPDC050187]|uniref:hypothetical protein n=1 Tax=Micromonospora sp. NPDC050187 TaxID=3364277 RepID=UPI0037899CF7
MTALRMIGLDLSLGAAAIAWTHDHHSAANLGVRTVHTARVNKDTVDHNRIHRVLEWVAAAAKARPHLAVIEGTFTRGGGSDIPLIGLRTVVCHWLWTKKIPYVDVAPATVKVWATGSGATRGENKVTKDKVIAEILATYGGLLNIDPRDDNQCDAVALLTLGRAAYGQPLVRITRAQQTRALTAVSWPTLATETGPVVPA